MCASKTCSRHDGGVVARHRAARRPARTTRTSSSLGDEALRVKARVVTCEAVLSEAFVLLRSSVRASTALRGMVTDQGLEVASLATEMGTVMRATERYRSVPMSFADASLVRLSELMPHCVVATLDSDFNVYRRNGRHVIPLLTPAD
jgi:predicted nucleic acid-binding protein